MAELSSERQVTLKAYCRIDAEETCDDALIQGLYDSAVNYMEQAGVRIPAADSGRRAQYDLCINYLVLDAYDRRDMMLSGALTENPAFRRIMNQLKLTEPVSDSDTGTGE